MVQVPSKRILVADDEKDVCDFFKSYFEKRKFGVDIAYDGRRAADLLKAGGYGYVFFDCNMPELTGVELIKVIRETNPAAKAIMISGYDLINAEFARDLKVDMFLTKPISLKDIEAVLSA